MDCKPKRGCDGASGGDSGMFAADVLLQKSAVPLADQFVYAGSAAADLGD